MLCFEAQAEMDIKEMNTNIKHKRCFFIYSSFPKGAESHSVPFGKKLAAASLSRIDYDIFGKPRLYALQA